MCIRFPVLFLTLFAFTFAALAGTVRADDGSMNEQQATNFAREFCFDCHTDGDSEAGLNLKQLLKRSEFGSDSSRWEKVAGRVFAGQMPPPDYEQPGAKDRQAFSKWVRNSIHAAVCSDGIQPGPQTLRRLNRREYGNTIRDLLGIHVNAGHALPADGAGGEGFDNASETLFISPIHGEKYLDAARTALGHAFKDPESREMILVATPDDGQSSVDAAKSVLSKFLPRAFRRPITKEELADYVSLFENAESEGRSFAAAIQLTLVAALVSPKFLFLIESTPKAADAELITHYEMASRLSYFMWGSMPDTELFKLAEQKKLHEPDVLREQVKRMLTSRIRNGLRKGAKVREFSESFVEQWLGTRALGREFRPDPSVAPDFGSEMLGAMKYEPVFFFEDILAENKSLVNWIESDFTYVNNRLARHYGIKGRFREQPKFVSLPKDSPRGGVLGMSAVLAISSRPNRTSPVLRGKWILETLLGAPPPPPPPDVGELEEKDDKGDELTLREQLERHRSDSACASCHATMDPLGFGLENFDVVGKWRSELNGEPVDSLGELPDGTQFNGPRELRTLLLTRKDEFIRHFARKMLGYALARGLTNEDACVVDEIVQKLRNDDYKSHTLVFEIIMSRPFRYKQITFNNGKKNP